jgi:hypothetical protein
MTSADNFNKLKAQLDRMGFHDQDLVDAIKDQVMSREKLKFSLRYTERYPERGYFLAWLDYDQLRTYPEYGLRKVEACLSTKQYEANQVFAPNIGRKEMLAVLHLDVSLVTASETNGGMVGSLRVRNLKRSNCRRSSNMGSTRRSIPENSISR